MKKKLFLLIAAFMAMGQSAFAYYFSAVAPSGQTLYYNILSGTTAQVTHQNSSTPRYSNLTGALTIPSSVTYNGTTYSVTSIGYWAFTDCSGLTSVTIPNSVTSIGGYAFADCSGLTSVTIPSSVTSIDEGAFHSCSGLTSVTIPNSVTSIGLSAFEGCNGLTSVTIGGSVTSIGNGAFQGCSGLTSIAIPNSVSSIGNYVFRGCSGLTSVTIPNSVTSIGYGAFDGVRHIDYHGNATGAPWGAFSMNGVTDGDLVYSNSTHDTLIGYIGTGGNVTIPNSVISIGNSAFEDCSGLTSVTIPNSVTSIGYNAFYDCIGLTSVTIPNSVTSIGVNAFYRVRHIEYHGNATGAPWTAFSMNGVIVGDFAFSNSDHDTLIAYIGNGGNVTIPNSVTSIGSYSFCACNGLTSVTIPNSVISIGNSAFYGCSGLTSITIGNSVTSIGYDAFNNCSGLDTVYMKPSTPPTLGGDVFADNATNRVFILYGCTYNDYYNANTWYSYRSALREPIIDIDINLAVNDSLCGHAAIVPAAGNRDIACDSTAVIQATANYGYHFSYWNDGNTSNPRNVTLTQDTAFTAIFDRNEYQLTLSNANPTFGTVNGGGTYLYLDTAQIVANANEHYHMVRWSDGDHNANRDIVVTADLQLTATFAIDTHTVSVVPNDITRGTIIGDGGYAYGTPCTLTAIAYTGYAFQGWSNGQTANPYTFAVMGDVELTALFVEEGEDVYTVTVESADPTMGTVSGGGQALDGGTVTIRAIPNEGYRFVRWNDGNTDNPRIVTVTGDVTYTAYFESMEGIEDVRSWGAEVRVYTVEGKIVVEGAEGHRVMLYDALGRLLTHSSVSPARAASSPNSGEQSVRFDVPSSGVYLIKIGNYPARRVVVIR